MYIVYNVPSVPCRILSWGEREKVTHQTELCCFETQITRKCRGMPLSNFLISMVSDLEVDSEANP